MALIASHLSLRCYVLLGDIEEMMRKGKMDDNSMPRIPKIGEYVRGFGRLLEKEDVTPPTVQVYDYIFEGTSARLEGRINGHVVKTYSTFYGENTCVKHAISEAMDALKRLGESDFELVVVKITKRSRMRPTQDVHFYDRKFRQFMHLECGRKRDLPDEVEEDVWSSFRKDVIPDLPIP